MPTVEREGGQYPFLYLPETESTNLYLKNLLLEPDGVEEFTTVRAAFQTAGRGQQGNHWESERDKNLLFSVYLKPNFLLAKEQFLLLQAVSLAVKKFLDSYTHDIFIKWPNDIYWKDRKICGILIENSLQSDYIMESIAGIGININQTQFVSDAPNPISLKSITGEEYDLSLMLDEILLRIRKYHDLLKEGDWGDRETIVSEYKQALFRKDGFHLFNDGDCDFLARIYDVLPDGQLVLQTEEGDLRSFYFKQVRYVLV